MFEESRECELYLGVKHMVKSYGLRTLFVFVTVCAISAWYFTPPPTGAVCAARLLNANESTIQRHLRQFGRLDSQSVEECIGTLDEVPNQQGIHAIYDAAGVEVVPEFAEYEVEFLIKHSRLAPIYHGCIQWAEQRPKEAVACAKAINEADRTVQQFQYGKKAILRGLTEGLAAQDLRAAYEIPAMFWSSTEGDSDVYYGLYGEVANKSLAFLTDLYDSIPVMDGEYEKRQLLNAFERRFVKEDMERYIQWVEKHDFDHQRISAVAEVNPERAIQWIEDLVVQREREDLQPKTPNAEIPWQEAPATNLLGDQDYNVFNVVRVYCHDDDELGFLRWVETQLNKQPTQRLVSSWHSSIAEVVDDQTWAETDDFRLAEPYVFGVRCGIVNYPAIQSYLWRLPDKDRLQVARAWLEPNRLASFTETQQDDVRKGIAAGLMWDHRDAAREIVGQMRQSKDRALFELGFQEMQLGFGSHIGWLRETGLRVHR